MAGMVWRDDDDDDDTGADTGDTVFVQVAADESAMVGNEAVGVVVMKLWLLQSPR
jgi:hypothetical protein